MNLRRVSLVVTVMLVACAWVRAAEPPTEAECAAFAGAIEAGVAQHKPEALDDAIDLKGILLRATEGTSANENDRRDFVDGASQNIGLGKNIVEAIRKEGTYKFIRARSVDGKQKILFRMLSAQGVNYHDFTVEKTADGKPRISDVFIFLMGEPLEQTMRRLFLQAIATKGGLVGKLLGWENDFIKNAGKFQQIAEAVQQGQAAEARRLYFELPESMQNERTMLVMRTQWAGQLGETEYEAAFVAINKAFPNDPSMQFIGIDGLFLNKKFDEGIHVMDNLIKTLGPDAHLYMLKGNFYMVKGDLPNAVTWNRKAIEQEPDLLNPYWALLTCLLQQKDFAEVKNVMIKMEQGHLVAFDDAIIAKNENYAEFVKSPEFEKWKTERPQQTPDGDGAPAAKN